MEAIQTELQDLIFSYLDRHPDRDSRNALADYLLVARPTLTLWAKGRNLPAPRIAWSLVQGLKANWRTISRGRKS